MANGNQNGTATVDYDALLAKHGGTVAASPTGATDYDALLQKHGGTIFGAGEVTQPEEKSGWAKAWDWATKPIMSRGHFLSGVLTGDPNNDEFADVLDKGLDKAKEYANSLPSGFDV